MKNINKILGVILTLALLAGSLVMTFPAAAADEFAAAATDTWLDDVDQPTMVMGTETNIFTIAADGTTMFMWTKTSTAIAKAVTALTTTIEVASTDGFPASGTLKVNAGADVLYSAKGPRTFTIVAAAAGTPAAGAVITAGTTINAAALYKSIDAGKTWSASNLASPGTAAGVPVTMLEVCPTDLTQLVATDGVNLYRSVNGGKNWSAAIPITTFGASTLIRSIDIVEGPDGATILVGTDVGVWQSDPALGAWNNLAIAFAPYVVAFSPDYMNDEQRLAVVDNGPDIQLFTKLGTGAWNADLAIGTLKENNLLSIGTIDSACIAFPTDYNWGTTNQVFVGISDLALGTGTAGDVYRVNGGFASASAKDTGLDADVFSVAVGGTKADSTVIASKVGSGINISTDADTASAPSWSGNGVKNPVGNNPVLVRASTGILYAGVADAHSGFYQATPDFKSYNGISRNEVSNIYTYEFSRGAIKDGGYQAYYYKNAGNWEMRLASAKFLQVPTSAARGGAVMYAIHDATPKQILKTIDSGLNWNTISSPGNKAVTTFGTVTDDLYYIGYAGGKIRSNTGAEISLANVSGDPSSISVIGKYIVVGVGSTGAPFRQATTWLYAADGLNFKILGTQDQWVTARASKFVVSQKTIYVVKGDGTVWSYALDKDTSWQQSKTLNGIPNPALITKIDVISDTMFLAVKDAAASGLPQIYRSLPAKTFDFRAIPDTTVAQLGGQVDGISVYDNADGSFNIKPGLAPINEPYPAYVGTSIGKLYADTTIGQITLTSPADGAQLNNPVDLSWKAAKKSGIDYEWQVARDAGFDFVVASGGPDVSNVFGVLGGGLTTGQTYYWRVRVNNNPTLAIPGLNGLWSDARSFTVKTIGNVNAAGIGQVNSVYPPQGEINISTSPVLTWGTVATATYNIKIATDSAFTSIVESKDGLTVAVYQPSKKLDAGKVYFWEVQAVSGGIASDWVAFAFTTAVPAVPVATAPPATVAPPQTIIVPTPTFNVPAATVTVNPGPTQAPATPAYIWFIIVIGAVLVIAVIVLIVRTRRV